jgi:hypothetical protein
MKAKDVKAGDWYETKLGEGECLAIQGSVPPMARMRIVRPFPRGIVYVPMRDVIRKIEKPM